MYGLVKQLRSQVGREHGKSALNCRSLTAGARGEREAVPAAMWTIKPNWVTSMQHSSWLRRCGLVGMSSGILQPCRYMGVVGGVTHLPTTSTIPRSAPALAPSTSYLAAEGIEATSHRVGSSRYLCRALGAPRRR